MKKQWLITLIGSLFFFYAFIQANSMTVLGPFVAKFFKANASTISMLSACYFYGNMIFILPAGLLLDRLSVKKLMIIGMILSILGSLIFAISQNAYIAALGRFLSGTTMSLGLIAPLKLASMWLKAEKMAIASSLIVTIGMFGGVVSQAPLGLVVQNFGWQAGLYAIALLGIFITLLLAVFVKTLKQQRETTGILESLIVVFKNFQNWYCSFFISLVNLPISILGAFLGTAYLLARGFSFVNASMITSMLFIGMIIGSPVFGGIADFYKTKKKLMYIGSFLCFLFSLTLFNNSLNMPLNCFLFFVTGFFSSSQVLGYPLITESNAPRVTATALSVATIIIMGLGYGVAIPFVGWILDLTWQKGIVNDTKVYSLLSYKKALLIVPISVFSGFITTFFIKEKVKEAF